MPARLVKQHNAMRPGHDGLTELSQEEVHCGSVEPGHHQGDAGVTGRAYGPDDRSRLVADIAQPARGMATLPPDIAGPPLLSDACLVLAPDFKLLGFRMRLHDFRQAGSKPPFLKACWAFSLLCGWRGRVFRCDTSDHSQSEHPGITVLTPQRSSTHRHRSTMRHRVTLSTIGSGPANRP